MAASQSTRTTIVILYFLFISFLFCLPGSALPSNDWLDKIWFDKWVHIGLFGVLLSLLNWAFNSSKIKQTIVYLLIVAAVYGLLVEVVQKNFIPNRSFDMSDWVADMIGAIIGTWVWYRYIKK
jgi:VanZ family protein